MLSQQVITDTYKQQNCHIDNHMVRLLSLDNYTAKASHWHAQIIICESHPGEEHRDKGG